MFRTSAGDPSVEEHVIENPGRPVTVSFTNIFVLVSSMEKRYIQH